MVYEEGVLKSTTAYHKDGSLKSKYEYDFIGGQFRTIKQFNEDSMLVEEWISPTDNKPLGTIKQWHENGQLKYEAYFTGNIKFQGLMTLYDEQGNILEQERYEDGEIIEKIK
jgi:antitoxin component YwqK of YwqJK toxin-antitoxin module